MVDLYIVLHENVLCTVRAGQRGDGETRNDCRFWFFHFLPFFFFYTFIFSPCPILRTPFSFYIFPRDTFITVCAASRPKPAPPKITNEPQNPLAGITYSAENH